MKPHCCSKCRTRPGIFSLRRKDVILMAEYVSFQSQHPHAYVPSHLLHMYEKVTHAVCTDEAHTMTDV